MLSTKELHIKLTVQNTPLIRVVMRQPNRVTRAFDTCPVKKIMAREPTQAAEKYQNNNCHVPRYWKTLAMNQQITKVYQYFWNSVIMPFFRCSKILGEAGKQKNFTRNASKILDLKSSSEQIFSRKLSLGAPDKLRITFEGQRSCPYTFKS